MKTYTTCKKFSFAGHYPNSKYCDVNLSTLDGAGRVLAAHRVVLAAASDKLEKLFDSSGEGLAPVIVRNIRFEVLKKIKDMIYSGNVEVEDADIEDFQDGVDMLRVSVTEHGDKIPLKQMTSENDFEEFTKSGQPSLLANVSFNNNSVDVSNKLEDDSNSSVVMSNNLEEAAQANQDQVNCEKNKAISPFHTGSDVRYDVVSYQDKTTIAKNLSNPYFTENGFSSTDSEPEIGETGTSSDQIIKKIPKIKSIPDNPQKFRFPCPICPSKYMCKLSLVRHIKSTHDKIRLSCNLCNSKFTQKYDLVRHIKSVHEQFQIACHLCPSKFTQKRNLVRHIKSVHESIRHPCHLCTSKFTKKSNLVNHIKSVHEQFKICCNLCPSMFTEKRHLVRHVKSVHESIRHPCHLCTSMFTEKRNVVRHIKSVHEKIRLPCHLCPSQFTDKRNLVRHIKSAHE